MKENSFYTEAELLNIGLKKVGNNVKISKKASIYSPQAIEIGNNVRIDDFTILSGRITLKNHIHISAYVGVFAGDAGVVFEDFSAISSRSVIYAISDDYSGEYMTNSTIPDQYRHIISKKVIVGRHVVIGSGSTILPGVELKEGCSVGSMSLLTKSTEPWGVYLGIPAKRLKNRSKQLLNLENDMENHCKD